MPCKHEGGDGPCKRNGYGHCKVNKSLYAKGRIGTKSRATKSDKGEAGELIVAADLLARGLPTTKPFNRNGNDDLHFKASGMWFTCQVKIGAVNIKTNNVVMPGRHITSDIVAIVDLDGKRIRYKSNTPNPLPMELQ